MCFDFWQSREAPDYSDVYYDGPAETLAGLLGIHLNQTTSALWYGDSLSIGLIKAYYAEYGYKCDAGDDEVTRSLSSFKSFCIEQLQQEFKHRERQNPSRSQANLRMKLVAGLKYKQAKPDRHGMGHWGHVVAVKCWINKQEVEQDDDEEDEEEENDEEDDDEEEDDEGILEFDDKGNVKVSLRVLDYRDDPSGKEVQLPPESEIEAYWSLLPIFYYTK